MRNNFCLIIAAVLFLSGSALGKDKVHISDLKLVDVQSTAYLKINTITRGFDDYFYLRNICNVLKADFVYTSKQKKVTIKKGGRSCVVYINNSNKLLPDAPIMHKKRLYVSRYGITVILKKMIDPGATYNPAKRQFTLGKAKIFSTAQKKAVAKAPAVKPSVKAKKVILEKKGDKFAIKRIVLDAGHGGKDPGAVGKAGLYEKEVTLDIAKKLEKEIKEKLGREVIMTRFSDKYVSLPERCYIANKKQGDIFISIHMNANVKKDASGTEVYIYGREGSDVESKKLALRENLDMPSLYDKAIDQILGDIGKKSNENISILLAGFVEDELIAEIETVGRNNKKIMRAPFYVLANTDMPCILIEAAFITNIEEEKKLKTEVFRNKIVEGIVIGIEKFLAITEVEEVAKNTDTEEKK